jgi:hypothetical protein
MQGEGKTMQRRSWLIGLGFVIVLAALGEGCSSNDDSTIETIEGSGNVVTEMRELSAFHAVELNGAGEVTIEPGDGASITLAVEDNLIPYLTISVTGGRLIIGVRENIALQNKEMMIYRVTYPDALDELVIGGNGSMTVTSVGEGMTARINGAGTITMIGSGDTLNVEINGNGAINARDFAVNEAKATINGMGVITVNASDSLDVSIGGNGNIQYVGNPRVTEDIKGIGAIVSLEDGGG